MSEYLQLRLNGNSKIIILIDQFFGKTTVQRNCEWEGNGMALGMALIRMT